VTDLEGFTDRFFGLWSRHEPEAMAELYAPDAVHEDPNLHETIVGRDAIRGYYAEQWRRWPKARHGRRSAASASDRVFVEWWWQRDGTEASEVRGVSIFTVRDEQIVLDVAYWDPTDVRADGGRVSVY